MYIANIINKFGSFRYADIKTPFNPQTTLYEHLLHMIPTLTGKYYNPHQAKSDLTLRIIKTGDNHLSVVKKSQSAKEALAPKRTVDITGDGTISRTPTPPKPPAPRRQTIDIRSKRFKTANRIGGGGDDLHVSDSVAFDMQRRQSVAVENLRPKKVAATVAFKRRSIELTADAKNLSAPAKTIAREMATPPQQPQQPQPPPAKPTFSGKPAEGSRPAAKQPLEISRPVGRPPISQAARKRKALAHPTKPNESPATPPKVKRVDEKLQDEVCENEANILRSVGLVKKVVPDGDVATASTRCSVSMSRIDAKARSTSDDKEHGGKSKKSQNQRSPFLHRPFIEIKEEPMSDNDGDVVVVRPLKHSTPLSDGQRRAKKAAERQNSAASVKAAAAAAASSDDDDDSLMIIEDDWPAKPTAAARSSAARSSDVRRGAISVRDLSKMKSTEAAEKPADGGAAARRTLPKNVANASGAGSSILRPVNANANKPTSATNNTRAPQDPQPRDATYSSTQPPPLSVVGKSNAVSLLVKNQPPKESPSPANGPPPLPPLSINQSTSSGATPSSSAPSTPPSTAPNTLANGMLTEELASAVADTLLGNLPSLTARPSRPGASQPHSSDAGPVSRTLMENAYKMTDFFRSVIEDTLADLSAAPNLEAKVRMLELELERERSARAKEAAELKANTDRLLAEMKKSMEKERARCVQDTRKKCELERIKSVEDTKKKLWCAQCSKEALFYCCWNTSYCEHACQKKHW